MKKIILLCVFFHGFAFRLFAQHVLPEEKVNQQTETIAETVSEATDISELEDTRLELMKRPLDLNHCSREMLISSGLMDDLKADALIQHRSLHGLLIRLEELQTIDGFDLMFIRSLLPYVKLDGAAVDPRLTPAVLFEQGKHEIIWRMQRVVEKQEGYQAINNYQPAYNGSPWKIYSRYRFTAGNYFSMGIVAEKDAGEEYFKGKQSGGYDFYSMHLFIRPGGFVKAIVLGDYQVQFSQGLVAWSGLAFGKSSEVISVQRQGRGIRPYSSANEFGFLRGMAIRLQKNNWITDAWLSNRKLDANLIPVDTLYEDFAISSISEDGYHRNYSELADKNKIQQRIAGVHVQYLHKSVNLEFTNQYIDYNLPLFAGNNIYEKFDLAGKQLMNTSFGYAYSYRNIRFFGEIARDQQGDVAMLNGFLTSLDPRVSFSLVNRHYPADYGCISCNPFRESSKPQNEDGTYMGIQIIPIRVIKISAYLDLFSFKWLRYQVDAPGKGKEWLLQLTYTPSRSTEIYLRLKKQIKPADDPNHSNPIDHQENLGRTNLRFNARFKIGSDWIFQERLEWVIIKGDYTPQESGAVICQDLQYRPMGKAWSVAFRFAVFNTESYDSRVYAYEQDLPGSYSIPALYYEGTRYYVMTRYRIRRGMNIWLRFGRSIYPERSSIGTSSEAIHEPHKTEVKMQLRIDF